MSFVTRQLQFTFARSTGMFTGTTANTATLIGLRAHATINMTGGPSFATMEAEVYGMTPSMMNDLSTLGMKVMMIPRNSVNIQAGDATSGMSTVFEGTIVSAWTDYTGAPDVPFRIHAAAGLVNAVKPVPVTTYRGMTSVVTILSGLATTMGISFENSGVTAQLSNPYLAGTAYEQARQVVQNAGIQWNACENGVLAIWPNGGSRGGQVPLVAPPELINYPAYTANGLRLKTLFNRSIRFGGKIQVQSSLPGANATWVVCQLKHELACMMPNGPWESEVQTITPDLFPGNQ